MAKVTDPSETIVNRLQLMKLLYRYKGLLEWELSYLSEQRGETISLTLPPAPEARTRKKLSSVEAGSEDDTGRKSDQEKGSGKSEATAEVTAGGRLESACRYPIVPIESYAELVDEATTYVKALAEE